MCRKRILLTGLSIMVLGSWCCCVPMTRAAETAGDSLMKIAFLGDSISAGVGASTPARRYATLVTKGLSQGQGKFEEVNLAISGSTMVDQPWPAPLSSGYPHRLRQALENKPDILVIQHGTNDNAVGSSAGEFLWSYRQAVRAIKEKLPRTKIVCMTICPSWGVAQATDAWLNQANAGIQEIAAAEQTLLAHTNFKLRHRRDLFPDGIHPNDEGHRIMAESVLEALQANAVQSRDNFDFVCMGPGQYRICGYVFEVKPDNPQAAAGWVCFRGVDKNGFTYRSDYPVEMASAFLRYNRDFTLTLTSEKGPVAEGNGHRDNYTGQGMFSLPPTGEKEFTGRINY